VFRVTLFVSLIAMNLTLAILAVTTPILAQTKPCLGLNDTSTNVTNVITGRNGANPGEWAWQYAPAANLTVRCLRIFTGNRYTDSHMKLAIWSAGATTPAKELAGGTFFAPKTTAKDWVGTNLDAAVTMKKGTKYWIVWTETGWSTPPFESGGSTTLPAARRFGTGWSLGGRQAFKCRFYCSPIDVKSVTSFGKACSGVSTGLGMSFAQTTPNIGNANFRIEGTGFPANANAFLALGTAKTWPSIPFGPIAPNCYSNTDIKMVFGGKTGLGNIRATAGPSGHVTYNIPIPNNSVLKGVFVAFQIAAADAASKNALPLVFSNATRATVF
jgi:hypothetical protein